MNRIVYGKNAFSIVCTPRQQQLRNRNLATIRRGTNLHDLLPAVSRRGLLRLVCRDGVRVRREAYIHACGVVLSRDPLKDLRHTGGSTTQRNERGQLTPTPPVRGDATIFFALGDGKSVSGVKSMTPHTRSRVAAPAPEVRSAIKVIDFIRGVTCHLPFQRDIYGLPDPRMSTCSDIS